MNARFRAHQQSHFKIRPFTCPTLRAGHVDPCVNLCALGNSWGYQLRSFPHLIFTFFQTWRLKKRSYHFQNSLPLELRNTKHPFRHPKKKGEQDFLWCFGTPVPMGSRCSPDTQLCCYTKYEAKQAEERKRDEDWANCLPPIEDMWAMKKGSLVV